MTTSGFPVYLTQHPNAVTCGFVPGTRAGGETRTLTGRDLNAVPLPLGYAGVLIRVLLVAQRVVVANGNVVGETGASVAAGSWFRS